MKKAKEAARRYSTEDRPALELWVSQLQEAMEGSEDVSVLKLKIQGSKLPGLPLNGQILEALSEALSDILNQQEEELQGHAKDSLKSSESGQNQPPNDRLMTTQEAANVLQVSRPFVVKLMESGRLPYQRIGTHRRVRMVDLVRYQKESFVLAQSALDTLAQEGQSMQLGY